MSFVIFSNHSSSSASQTEVYPQIQRPKRIISWWSFNKFTDPHKRTSNQQPVSLFCTWRQFAATFLKPRGPSVLSKAVCKHPTLAYRDSGTRADYISGSRVRCRQLLGDAIFDEPVIYLELQSLVPIVTCHQFCIVLGHFVRSGCPVAHDPIKSRNWLSPPQKHLQGYDWHNKTCWPFL